MTRLLLILVTSQAMAQERAIELAPVQVFGTTQQNRPLAPQKVDKRKFETHQFTDVNRALKQTSGVYTREEDGMGLRPNIGLRGTNPDRSKKITILEDDVLIGPAPYSAPAAYYTPGALQTESIEVFKGFAGLPYGPNSVGGAINYLTPTVPAASENNIQLSGGSFNTGYLRASTGSTYEWGGFLLNGFRFQTDGFKELDGGGNTGFEQNYLMGKALVNLPGASHTLQLTAAYALEHSNETYLGLTESDFFAKPYRRYIASTNDNMDWKHYKAQLRHQKLIGESGTLQTTVYQHQFHRDWYRLDGFRSGTISLRDVLKDPTAAAHSVYYDILRGADDSASAGGTDGQLIVVNNDRTYMSRGVQSKFTQDFNTQMGRHAVEFFARYHFDRIDRNHTADYYEMINGRMIRTNDPTQLGNQNFDQTHAVTLSAIDNWDIAAFTVTPVLRFEHARFTSKNHTTGVEKNRSDQVLLPGLSGLIKHGRFSERLSVNRAATLTGIAIDGSEKREEAMNYEFEFRFADAVNSEEAAVVLFYNDYQNITGTCTASGGCTSGQLDEVFNGGAATIWGAEIQVGKSFYSGVHHWPVQFQTTLLKATFDSTFDSTSPDWGIGTVNAGDPLPYIPQIQYGLNVGHHFRKWRNNLSFTYQSKVYDQAASDNRLEVRGYGVVDWVGSYEFSRTHNLKLKVDNILNHEYAVAARPFGFRPGKPRTVMLAWTYQF